MEKPCRVATSDLQRQRISSNCCHLVTAIHALQGPGALGQFGCWAFQEGILRCGVSSGFYLRRECSKEDRLPQSPRRALEWSCWEARDCSRLTDFRQYHWDIIPYARIKAALFQCNSQNLQHLDRSTLSTCINTRYQPTAHSYVTPRLSTEKENG